MNSAPSPAGRSRAEILRPSYQAALEGYLKRPAAGLENALRLGRRAVALKMKTLDLARLHEQALIGQALRAGPSGARNRIVDRARRFFSEAILPMESTHRSAIDSQHHLSRLVRSLRRRTLELSGSNRKLMKEIHRRRALETTLRKSEKSCRTSLRQSKSLQAQLRSLSRRVLSMQEDDRKRISRELHDVVAQMLTGINLRLTALKAETTGNAKGLGRKIANTQRLVAKSVDVVHRFARELRPAVLDDLGLVPALLSFLKDFRKETGISVRISAFQGLEELSFPKRTTFYRVALEAISNVARHARAERIHLSFCRRGDDVCMVIRDDGGGFDPVRAFRNAGSRRLGLLGMRERLEMIGGSFAVESSPGKGTVLIARIPAA